jgi:hypothetical protein
MAHNFGQVFSSRGFLLSDSTIKEPITKPKYDWTASGLIKCELKQEKIRKGTAGETGMSRKNLASDYLSGINPIWVNVSG